MTVDLDEIEQLARAETQGKRAIELDGNGYTVGFAPDQYVGYLPLEDAELVAATDAPAVLELVRRLRAAEAPGDVGSVKRLMFDLDRYRAIVRDLAAAKPTVQSVGNNAGDCPLCYGVKWEHAGSCPWRRAVEAKP